ncbi:TPA: hypothetical protein ACH3X1_009895 [Trebouxia sp. C0004]
MSKRSAAASAAAHAASKKNSAVELTAGDEDRARQALQQLDLLVGPKHPQAISNWDKEELVSQLSDLCDSLLAEGFRWQDIQEALQAVPMEQMSEATVLDWLCLHVDPANLPRRYAGGVQSRAAASGLKLVAKAKASKPAAKLKVTVPVISLEEQARQRRVKQLEQQARDRKAAEAAAKEKDAQRQWILQYAEEDSESDPNEDQMEQAEEVIEDWELWGDPREVERRKADRARAAQPLHVRQAQVASEWGQAKAEASQAKAAGDKNKQKSIGQVIRSLKQEMKALGLDEQKVEEMIAPQVQPALGDADEFPTLGAQPAAPSQSPSQPLLPSQARPSHLQRDTEACQAKATDADDDSIAGGLGLFEDEEGKDDSWAGPQATQKPKPKKLTGPWGEYGTPAGGTNKKGGKKLPGRPQEVAVVKLPKALLQQHCQKLGWAPPRFDKLPLGGGRLPTASLRYSVTLEPAPQGKGKKAKAAARPKTYALHEDEDGWEGIQEAQNAAATRALFQLAEGQDVYQLLASPYQDLWLHWLDQGNDAYKQQAKDSNQQRLDFVRSVVAAAAINAGAASQNGSAEHEAAAANGAEAAPHAQLAPQVRQQSQSQRAESHEMAASLEGWRSSREGGQWQQDRARLPVLTIRQDLLAQLAEHDVVVVSGDTGCGKTTQVPQYLLEAATEAGEGGQCNVICTQPRRIAAISVAERVANERGDSAPGTPGSRVGYHVRLDAAMTRSTRLLFCTTGILLRRLGGDLQLHEVSHIIVDEVHERTLQGDFLMALLRDLVISRRTAGNPLKVILMSATLDSHLFANYFGGAPALAAGGRTFQVEQYFLEDAHDLIGYHLDAESNVAMRPNRDAKSRRQLEAGAGGRDRQGLLRAGWGDDARDPLEAPLNPHFSQEALNQYSSSTQRNIARLDEDRIDFDLLEELVSYIDQEYGDGAILVFLPGIGEISSLQERLSSTAKYRQGQHWVIPLHSSVSPGDQRQAFKRPPEGVRKIVIATNIAETSLTIEDVVYVVDCGKLKERRHDPKRGMSLLVEDWVSRASALQRKGRAGRVRAGVCWGMYTRHRFEHRMRRYQAPEMVRVPLEELVLQIHLLGLGPAGQFLEKVLEPPPKASVEGALTHLQALGALTTEQQLTPLGRHLSQLPVDAGVGKLLVLGAALGCLSTCLTVAACLSYRTPFAASHDQQDAAGRVRQAMAAPGGGNIASGQQSDHLLMAAAYNGWLAAKLKDGRQGGRVFARKHFLSEQTLDMLVDMRWQFACMLADIKLIGGNPRGSKGRDWMDDGKQAFNAHANKQAVVKSVLSAALYPNVAVMDDGAGPNARPTWHDGQGGVVIHPSSVNHPLIAVQYLRPYLVYLEKMRTSQTFLRDTTVTSPLALLLFGGQLEVVHGEGYVLVDGWIRIRAAAPTAVLVQRLRGGLDTLLQQRIKQPGLDWGAQAGVKVGTE